MHNKYKNTPCVVRELYERNNQSPRTWNGGPLRKDANLSPYWSHALDQLPHFLAPLSPLPGPKHPLSPSTRTCELLTDNDDINTVIPPSEQL
jgi:hypothetical protein